MVPNNYHAPSVNSRQYQLTLQQAVPARSVSMDMGGDIVAGVVHRQHQHQHQRLLEQQSRAMLEASKVRDSTLNQFSINSQSLVMKNLLKEQCLPAELCGKI